MTIAKRLKWYLEAQHVNYEIVPHRHTHSMLESARAAHVPRGRVAKCVLLEDERGYVIVVVPASCRVDLAEIELHTGRHLELATEREVDSIFESCSAGAIPPLGAAFNIPTAIDQSLMRMPDVYFEEGDHQGLVHVTGSGFRALVEGAPMGHFGRPH